MAKKISGRHINLKNGGSIWISDGHVKNMDGNDARGILFKNSAGEETRLGLSDEALAALVTLAQVETSKERLVWSVLGAVEGLVEGRKASSVCATGIYEQLTPEQRERAKNVVLHRCDCASADIGKTSLNEQSKGPMDESLSAKWLRNHAQDHLESGGCHAEFNYLSDIADELERLRADDQRLRTTIALMEMRITDLQGHGDVYVGHLKGREPSVCGDEPPEVTKLLDAFGERVDASLSATENEK